MAALEEKLQELVDRQEIRDVLVRLARGSDRADIDLIRSGFHPDATITYHADFGGNAWAAYERRLREPDYIDSVGTGDASRNERVASQHHLTNHRVQIEGDQAWSEQYFLGYHITAQGDDLYVSTVGGRYVDRFERRDGEWRVAARLAVHDWDRVDKVVGQMPTAVLWTQGLMNRDDPSYWSSLAEPVAP